MTRVRTIGYGLTLALSTSLAFAQTPAGNPTESADANVGAPNADATGVTPPHPTPAQRGFDVTVPRDSIDKSADVPVRTIELTTVDESDRPLPRVHVELVPHATTATTKPASPIQRAISDEEGRLTFSNLPPMMEAPYRLVTVIDDVRTSSQPFSLERTLGIKAKIHVYPIVRELRQALVVARSFWFLEPREDGIYLEFFTEFLNLGASTWAPSNVELNLPDGFMAFSSMGNDPDVFVQKSDSGVALSGALSPGQHSVTFSVKVPSGNQADLDLVLPLFAQTAEVRVATVTRPNLSLSVEGYPEPQLAQANGQVAMLMTSRAYNREGLPPPQDLRLTLSGLPVQGPGRIIAVSLAVALVLGAFVAFGLQRRRNGVAKGGSEELEAKERLLEELVQVTRAHRAGQLSDETFSDTQRVLVSAAVRLERQNPSLRN